MKYLLIIGFALSLFSFGFAQEKEISPCDDVQNQMNMNACAHLRYQEADADLNKSYSKLMKMVGEEMEEKIRIAQRTWVKFRDEHCECHRYIYDGGSISPLVWSNCLRKATENRSQELNDLIESLDM